MAKLTEVDGRPVITRAEMRARGVPTTTAEWLYRHRSETGHPAVVPGTPGRTMYWYDDEWSGWYEQYRRRRTQIDRSGNPQELVDSAEAARILGYEDEKSVSSDLAGGRFADPDGYAELEGGGLPSPRWKRETIWAHGDAPRRRGQGRPAGTPGRAKAHPYAGDPRLDAVLAWLRAGQQLTAPAVEELLNTQFGAESATSSAVAARILTVARQRLAE